jgi:hypothetical protein
MRSWGFFRDFLGDFTMPQCDEVGATVAGP